MLKRVCFILLFSIFSFQKLSASEERPLLCHTAEEGRLRQLYEESIAGAKKSILVFTFTFSDPGFIELLNQKADEGVDVVVVINKDHCGPLRIHGSDKLQIVTRMYGEGRVHHKILVVDDEQIWLGSTNFSTGAFTSQENLVVGVKNSDLCRWLRHEADVFLGKQKRSGVPAPTVRFGEQEIDLFMLPHCDPRFASTEKRINERGKQELLSIIKEAQHSIRIAMMVWTDPELASAVLAAHRRGVVVEVLFQDLRDTVAMDLKRTGMRVMTNPRLKFMHSKWMWVDGTTLVNGSANWSRSSFSRNDESFIVVKNLDDAQRSYMEDYWTYLSNHE